MLNFLGKKAGRPLLKVVRIVLILDGFVETDLLNV